MGQRTDELCQAMALLAAIGGSDDKNSLAVIPGAPWSKSRPRFARRTGVTYSDPRDGDAEYRTGMYLKRAQQQPLDGNVAVACIFYRPNSQRIDVDNLLKHVCDAANRILWHDDSQVTALVGILELDRENPRTVVGWAAHTSSLKRGSDATIPCEVCGTQIQIHPSSTRRTCSRDCATRLKGFNPLSDPVPCENCQQPFIRTNHASRFCSPQCRGQSRRSKRKPSQRALSDCVTCGKQLTHNRGGQCRDCWRDPNMRVKILSEIDTPRDTP